MLPERFADYTQLINNFLDQTIPSEQAPPEPIYKAMRYSIFAGGKRFRPGLVLAAAESLGADPAEALPVAAAIEMIHTYSLIHDDLPSMDNDDYRRGKPTNHKVFGEAIAILAGDALLTAGFEAIAQANYPAEIRFKLLALLTKAIGPQGMIGGQVLDIGSESKELSRVQLERMHGMKTAALIGFSAAAPPVILAKAEEVERAFRQYGESIGLAFQIVDDILDVEGKTEELGKTAGKDHKNNKATYPSTLGLAESHKLASDLISLAVQSVAPYDRFSYLNDIARYILERKN